MKTYPTLLTLDELFNSEDSELLQTAINGILQFISGNTADPYLMNKIILLNKLLAHTKKLNHDQIMSSIPEEFYTYAIKIIKLDFDFKQYPAFVPLIVETFCNAIKEKKIDFTQIGNKNLLDDCAQFINNNIVENENLRAYLQNLLTESTLSLK